MSGKTGFLIAGALAAVVLGGSTSDLQAAQSDRHPAMLPQRPVVELLHTHQEQIAYRPPENIIARWGARRIAAVARARQQKRLVEKTPVMRPRQSAPVVRLLIGLGRQRVIRSPVVATSMAYHDGCQEGSSALLASYLGESMESMLKEPRRAAIVNAFQLADEVLRFAETHPAPSRQQRYVRAIAGTRANVFADLNQQAIEEYSHNFAIDLQVSSKHSQKKTFHCRDLVVSTYSRSPMHQLLKL
jgi:hypothetical protein